jgi:hypothetical protein
MTHKFKTSFQFLPLILLLTVHSAWSQNEVETFFDPPSKIAPGTGAGTASLTPNQLTAAQIDDFEVLIEVGEAGIQKGGGILVDFPKAWFPSPFPVTKAVQMENSNAPHFVQVHTSKGDDNVSIRIEKRNVQNKAERFRHLMRITVDRTALQENDQVMVLFLNTTAPYISGWDTVNVYIDADASGQFRAIEKQAPYQVAPLDAIHANLFTQSQAVVGEPSSVQLSLFDPFFNPALGDVQSVLLAGLPTDNGRPKAVKDGVVRWNWTPKEPGYYWPEAFVILEGKPRKIAGGPIRVYAEEPSTKVYWGDLHSHSDISKDAIGYGDYPFARDITRLDFFASTEHAGEDGSNENDVKGDGITRDDWDAIQKKVADFYDPGNFVTILAYECAFNTGHHNVFFRNDGIPIPARRFPNVMALWELLDKGNAFSVPHHPGIMWGGGALTAAEPGIFPLPKKSPREPRFGPRVDWDAPHDEERRPMLEIYSAHGQSEYYDPEDPLAYEMVRFTLAGSGRGDHYARDAWALGTPIGVIAASDNHFAKPGLSHYGLTAVRAPSLTRDAIFDSLLTKQCYGTTGERIILEFELNGTGMGQKGTTSGEVSGTVTVAAPSDIDYAEVLAVEVGSNTWETVARWDNPGRLIEQTIHDTIDSENKVYYLRTELKKLTNGRVARAWSSPIFLSSE